MEYVKGGMLKRLFTAEEQLTDADVSTIMKNLLEGVDYIHQMNYIHRDLKPENILLEGQRGFGVKIVDFGLSTSHNAIRGDNINDKMGTLLFMTPGQAKQYSYSKRVDIWACGIIMYQLLS